MQQRYQVTLTGATGLIMHADDLTWRAQMERWGCDPENKKLSRPGDDRTPAFRWLGSLYHDATKVGIPSDNLMTALREGGSKVSVPGKKNLTYKKQSQSGIVVDQILWPVVTPKGQVSWPECKALLEEKDYEKHEAAALVMGFELFAKGAKVGMSKHVRVRPRFDQWSASGTVTVTDETITASVLQTILDCAGTYCGLGDWRPSSPKSPGPWGRFTAVVVPK